MSGGRVERVERHARRLLRDAERLGLSLPNPRDIETLFVEIAAATFGRGDGIIRVEWSKTESGPLELIATPRPTASEPDVWRAVQSKATHPGPEHRRNTKYVDVQAYDIARAEVTNAEIDEVLLFDSEGLLVEGGRSNFLVVRQDGRLASPDHALGGVEGIGLTIVLESLPATLMARLNHDDILSARELMSVNAVRGVVPIVELDGRPIGDGLPGRWAKSLRNLFNVD